MTEGCGAGVSGFGEPKVENPNVPKAGNFHPPKAVELGRMWQTAPLAGDAMATGCQHVDNLGRDPQREPGPTPGHINCRT